MLVKRRPQSNCNTFWQLWKQQQDYLYKRCLSWMKGNPIEAEEALSRASIKAWEKWQDYAEKVTNPKAWLTQLTYNLCMDMHREHSREVGGIESLENVAVAEDEYVASSIPSPESAVLDRERAMYIRRAINALPANVRMAFILWYDEEMSYSEIAQKLALSCEKIRKLVQQARTILQKQLNQYFSGLDDSSSCLDSPCAPHPPACGTPLKKRGTRGGDSALAMPWGIGGVSALKKLECERTATADCKTSITTGCTTPESIDYKVTATCLEVLSHTWYSSPSCLGWR